jgi:hypothetical protein
VSPSRLRRNGFNRNVAHDIPYFAPPLASANETIRRERRPTIPHPRARADVTMTPLDGLACLQHRRQQGRDLRTADIEQGEVRRRAHGSDDIDGRSNRQQRQDAYRKPRREAGFELARRCVPAG